MECDGMLWSVIDGEGGFVISRSRVRVPSPAFQYNHIVTAQLKILKRTKKPSGVHFGQQYTKSVGK